MGDSRSRKGAPQDCLPEQKGQAFLLPPHFQGFRVTVGLFPPGPADVHDSWSGIHTKGGRGEVRRQAGPSLHLPEAGPAGTEGTPAGAAWELSLKGCEGPQRRWTRRGHTVCFHSEKRPRLDNQVHERPTHTWTHADVQEHQGRKDTGQSTFYSAVLSGRGYSVFRGSARKPETSN